MAQRSRHRMTIPRPRRMKHPRHRLQRRRRTRSPPKQPTRPASCSMNTARRLSRWMIPPRRRPR
ncbi:MAG: hypothetical protein EA396_07630 [Anaerolineaceae bacterium]|nr:MAG: hypothetical protein EA396_07630 [Anaerolineaceae bacterium]